MITSEKVTKAFKSELKTLLKKYNAEINSYDAIPEHSATNMTVIIPGIFEGENAREHTEINLESEFS